jgi:hypothetical protein
MRHGRALLLALLALLPAACISGPDDAAGRRGNLLRIFHHPAPAPDVIQMDVALIECPLAGAGYLNNDLWITTDEQVVDAEQRFVLAENGFRVGQVVGPPPTELQALLRSKRSCVNPRRRFMAAGTSVALLLGPAQAECRFHICKGDEPAEVVLEQAQFSLMVVPTPAADGKTRLHFTPKVEHGEPTPQYAPVPDQADWVMEIRRPSVSYPELAWDVTLAPNEYLVLGGWPDQTGTLGHESFLDHPGPRAMQRLLVLRTTRSGGGIDDEIADPSENGTSKPGQPPALALQAAWSTVRASRH